MNHTADRTKANIKIIFALTLVHFTGDFYASFIHPLLPVFAERYSLTLTQVGLITGISRLLAFVVQPSVGYVADRFRTRLFVLGGLTLAVVFIPLVGIAPYFWVLIIFVSLGSIGSSMYHPPCAGMVSTYAGGHFGFSMSVFILGGTLAFGVGPIFITCFVQFYHLGASPFTMIFGVAVMAYLFKVLPLPGGGEGLRNLGFLGALKETFGSVWKSIVLIWIVMVLRSFTGQSFLTFVPVLYAKEGHSLVSIGMIVSLFTVGGAISGLLAGHLSDKVGYKPVFFVAHAMSAPSLCLLLFLPGGWVYVGSFFAGFFVLATLPLGVAMAQELAPLGRSMVSSLMMGLAFGTGGMMTPLSGKLADIFSIRPVLAFLALIPLLTTALIAFFPGEKTKTKGTK
ncbi:MAG: MFS transporter [Deltaproteobacteria bacterium]|nr:MFS transporter [Deltaproteobacteria bacterium]